MNPKFKIDDPVIMLSPSLYQETTGKIVEVEKVFQALITGTDTFDDEGLRHRESDLANIVLPHKWGTDEIEITYPPNRTEKYRFNGFAYTVKTEKMFCIYPEHALIAKKQEEPAVPMKTFYEHWLDEDHGYANVSTFQELLMTAYKHADGMNRGILGRAYPNYFVNRKP